MCICGCWLQPPDQCTMHWPAAQKLSQTCHLPTCHLPNPQGIATSMQGHARYLKQRSGGKSLLPLGHPSHLPNGFVVLSAQDGDGHLHALLWDTAGCPHRTLTFPIPGSGPSLDLQVAAATGREHGGWIGWGPGIGGVVLGGLLQVGEREQGGCRKQEPVWAKAPSPWGMSNCPKIFFYKIQIKDKTIKNFKTVPAEHSVPSLSRVRLCDSMNHSTPVLPVHHQLPESTQTHVRWVSDAIQSPHPLSSPSPPALNLSQQQGLFQWVSFSHQVAKILEFQLQHQPFQRALNLFWISTLRDSLVPYPGRQSWVRAFCNSSSRSCTVTWPV